MKRLTIPRAAPLEFESGERVIEVPAVTRGAGEETRHVGFNVAHGGGNLRFDHGDD